MRARVSVLLCVREINGLWPLRTLVRAAYAGRHDIITGMINHTVIGHQRCAEALSAVPGYTELAARDALEHDGLSTFEQVADLANDPQKKRSLRNVACEMGDAAAILWLARKTPRSRETKSATNI